MSMSDKNVGFLATTASVTAVIQQSSSVCCADAASAGIIQWHLDYDACDVLLGQVHVLLDQVSHGAGMAVTHTTAYVLNSVRLCKG